MESDDLTSAAQAILEIKSTDGIERFLGDLYRKSPGMVSREDAQGDIVGSFVRLLTDQDLNNYSGKVDTHYLDLMADEGDGDLVDSDSLDRDSMGSYEDSCYDDW